MAHKLEGPWRGFSITFPAAAPPALTNDDRIYLNTIDPKTGKIVDGFHLVNGQALIISGEVIPNGSGYSVAMEHPEYRDPTRVRRYQGALVFDSATEDRLIILARTFTRPVAGSEVSPANAEALTELDSLAQDDGTVVITRP
jgi:hypothetical protein